MKTVVKEVHYCDFCKKRYLSKYFMAKHEKHCTANPNRECNICGYPLSASSVERFNNAYKITEYGEGVTYEFHVKWLKKFTIEDIKEEVENCPACTLAILRVCGLNRGEFMEMPELKFNYNEAKDAWWAVINQERMDSRACYGIDY